MTSTTNQGVTARARETARDFGYLVGQHVKLAQVEITAELRATSRRASLLAVFLALATLGYAFAIAGVALLLGERSTLGIPFLLIGMAHLAGGGLGMFLGSRGARGTRPLAATTDAMNHSLATLAATMTRPSAPGRETIDVH